MSAKHPVIAVTGSSGAGTTTTSLAFRKIFGQLNLRAAEVEGDSFHRYTRPEMDMAIRKSPRFRPPYQLLRPRRQ
ncbi:Phosphoribulokinase, plasmid [Kluyvera cryocrescens]|uniref:Phosphoribulokinase, plasmid n=1 Tax=Kluyvera cryocrescens TaxID=580 RepID=A0A485ARD9_KLUCR|nr:Phosphoribulokinase, plasmid [Kluyvera cryocrescens]